MTHQGNLIAEKSFEFSVRIVNLNKYLRTKHKEYVLSQQILRSGTSIGANVHEALQGQSKRDFLAKMNIALKEAAETEFWIRLLIRTGYVSDSHGENIRTDCESVIKILHAIVKTTKQKIKHKKQSKGMEALK